MIKISRIFITLLAFWFIIPFKANAYSVADAIQAAKSYNLDIKLSQDKLDNSKTARTQALSGFLPKVLLNNNNSYTNFRTPDTQLVAGNTYSRVTTFQVTQPLFEGGKSLFDLKTANASISSAENNLLFAEEGVILSTITAYAKLITAREAYEISVANENVLREQLASIQAKLSVGQATITDEAQTTAKLYEIISQKVSRKGDITNAETEFTAITGQQPPEKLLPIKYKDIPLPEKLEEFLATVTAKNPALKAAQEDVTAAKNRTRSAYSTLAPSVNAITEIRRSNAPKNYRNQDGESYTLNVQVPIFQGGAEYAGISSAKAKEREAQHNYEKSLVSVTQKVIETWSQYSITRSMIESSAKAISSAQKTLKGVKAGAEVGTKTNLDVLIAQQDLFSAKEKYLQAQQQNLVAVFTMQYLLNHLKQIDFTKL